MTPDPKYRQRVRLVRTCCWVAALFLFVAALLAAGTDWNAAGVFGVLSLLALRYAAEVRREIDGWPRRATRCRGWLVVESGPIDGGWFGWLYGEYGWHRLDELPVDQFGMFRESWIGDLSVMYQHRRLDESWDS